MATVNLNYMTIADVAKDLAPDGTQLKTAEILKDSTPMLEDMPWIEGNLPTGHKTALRTELPSSSWIGFYQGVTAGKGRKQTITFNTAMQRSLAETDYNLLRMAGPGGKQDILLMSDAKAHIMGMGQDFEDQIIYGAKDEPEKFPGLAATYDHISTSETDVGYNVIDAGGTTAAGQTSVWFIWWSDNNIHGIYPSGSTAGLSKKDYGVELIKAPDGNGEYEARRILYKMDGGLAIPDWRSVIRIANIDVAELGDAGESTFDGAPLINLFIKAIHRFKTQVKMGSSLFIYANRTVMTALDLIATNYPTLGVKSNVDAPGQSFMSFRGYPLRLAERIVDTENQVTT